MERKQDPRSHVATKNDQGEERIKMSPKGLHGEACRIFRRLPREQAFYFFTSVENYTGESAASFEEFLEKIKEVSVESLKFHLCRNDFGRWVAETLEDDELAEEILDLWDTMPTKDVLRKKLVTIVSRRREKLLSEEVV